MSDEAKRILLMRHKAIMADISRLAEALAENVLELEATGLDLPATKVTTRILAEVALGWQAGGLSDGV